MRPATSTRFAAVMMAVAVVAATLWTAPSIAGASAPAGPTATRADVAAPKVEIYAGAPLSDQDRAVNAANAARDQLRSKSTAALVTPTSTFQVHYTGFNSNPQAQAAFQRAVDAWAMTLVSSVPIKVEAEFTALPPQVLGSAGPAGLYFVPQGPFPDALYPGAEADAITGHDVDPGVEDIDASFSNADYWYFGTGAVPSGKYDFTTVVLHELGHGLGFLGTGRDNGSTGSLGLDDQGSVLHPEWITAYDMLTENSAGTPLTSLADPSTQLHSAFTTSAFIDGPAIRSAYGNQRAPLFTPGVWQGGSSYSHFNEASFASTNPDALMTPVLAAGEVHTGAGPLTTAVLIDSGWAVASPPGTATISGHVNGGTTPVNADAVVVDVFDAADIWVATTTSGSTGNYSVHGLAPGPYTVRFTDSKDRWLTEWSGSSPTQGGAVDVVGTADTTTTVDMLLDWPTGSGYTPITPTRLLDTRYGPVPSGVTVGQRLAAGRVIDLTVADGTLVPINATAVVMNVTATDVASPSFVTVWPTGFPRPNASNLNMVAGWTIPNLVTVKVGANHKVSLGNGNGATALIADIVGYYTASGGSSFAPLPPSRILDTRLGPVPSGVTIGHPVAPGQVIALPVTSDGGVAGVPNDATAVVLNVTATEVASPSFVTAWPSLTPRPNASNLNMSTGWTIPNLVIVKIGTDHKVNLGNGNGATALIADVVGYFGGTAPTSTFVPRTPVRVLDTRYGPVPPGRAIGATVAPGAVLQLHLADGNYVPSNATAVVMNVTATDVASPSFVTAWPAGISRPNASNLNMLGGWTVPNLVTVKIGTGGTVMLGNGNGSTALIADIVGYYTN